MGREKNHARKSQRADREREDDGRVGAGKNASHRHIINLQERHDCADGGEEIKDITKRAHMGGDGGSQLYLAPPAEDRERNTRQQQKRAAQRQIESGRGSIVRRSRPPKEPNSGTRSSPARAKGDTYLSPPSREANLGETPPPRRRIQPARLRFAPRWRGHQWVPSKSHAGVNVSSVVK